MGPLSFCCDCGAHTRASLRKLAKSCPRKMTTPAMAHASGLWKQGFHSTLGHFIGMLAPITHDVPPPVQSGDIGSESD